MLNNAKQAQKPCLTRTSSLLPYKIVYGNIIINQIVYTRKKEYL